MELTSTSPAPASEAIRDATCTAIPRGFSPSRRSTSPVWTPARTSSPSARSAYRISMAQRIARAGPSNAARNPSPAVSSSSPAKRSSARRTDRVVLVEEGSPARVAEILHALGGADEIGEEDGGQHAVGSAHGTSPGEELLDLVEDLVGVDGHEVVVAVRARRTARPRCARRGSAPPRPATSRSPVRCSTSVGQRTLGSSSRTSAFEFIRIRSRAPAGLSPARPRRWNQARSAASAFGAIVVRVHVLAPGALEVRGDLGPFLAGSAPTGSPPSGSQRLAYVP